MSVSGQIPLSVPLTDFYTPLGVQHLQPFQRQPVHTQAHVCRLSAIWQRAGEAAGAIRADAGCSLMGGRHRSAPSSWRPVRPVARSGRGFAGGYVRVVMRTEQRLGRAHLPAPPFRKAHVPTRRSWSRRPEESYQTAWGHRDSIYRSRSYRCPSCTFLFSFLAIDSLFDKFNGVLVLEFICGYTFRSQQFFARSVKKLLGFTRSFVALCSF